MKIAHISYSAQGGGAFIACRRLNNAMCASGIDSCILTAGQFSPFPSHPSLLQRLWHRVKSRCYWRKVRKELRNYNNITGTWSSAHGLNRLDSNKVFNEADLIYLHWVNFDMVSIEELGRVLDSGKQCVWFMHDMWPLTGGCHYSLECDKYQHHCSCCPMLSSNDEKDLSYSVFERKLRYLAGHSNLTIVAPSHWLAECAKKSRLFAGNRIEVIPNVIDTDVFRPVSKRVAREALGLPMDRKLVLFGCDAGSRNFYKGWDYLKGAFHKMDASCMDLVMFGAKEGDALNEISQRVHCLGRLHDEITLAIAYSAADVFVSPSIAENFSLTLCEASACMVPVVCFEVGGNSDIVLNKNTGYLAKYKNIDDLARGVEWCVNTPEYDTIAAQARNHIEQICSYEVVLKQHKDLIKTLCARKY